MTFSRRNFLRVGSLTAVSLSATGCSVAGRQLAQRQLPDELVIPTSEMTTVVSTTPIRRILNRAGYGPKPGDIADVQAMGLAAYLEEQLHPQQIDDPATDLLIRNLNVYNMDVSQLVEQEQKDAVVELIGSTLLRALYSKRQLYEAMVEFWSDHFNIYLRKNQTMPLLKIVDDRDVIRPYALGKFRDLLWASTKSPAMLVYLDNIQNELSHPNENYARELLELHTLGVHGGYTQTDVQEVARALTGWTVERRGRNKGKLSFKPSLHDDGEKFVLDQTIVAGQGEVDLEQILEMLVTHPATANFIATKLVRRFVADEPPQALVEQVAQTYQATDGDIKSMLRVIFLSEEFASAPPKLKRPYTYLVSTLRALHTDLRINRNRDIGRWLTQLGQMPFHWPPPDGYPDVAAAWAANLLPRWNFALSLLHNGISGAQAPLERLVTAGKATTPEQTLQLFASLVYGRSLSPSEAQPFLNYTGSGTLDNTATQDRLKDSVALMLASPEFQYT